MMQSFVFQNTTLHEHVVSEVYHYPIRPALVPAHFGGLLGSNSFGHICPKKSEASAHAPKLLAVVILPSHRDKNMAPYTYKST